jgi:hypothetical protein
MLPLVWVAFGLIAPIGAFQLNALPDLQSLASRDVTVIQPDSTAVMGPPIKFKGGRRAAAKATQKSVDTAPPPAEDPTDAEVEEAMKAAAAAEALPPALEGDSLANDVPDANMGGDPVPVADESTNMDGQHEVKLNVLGDTDPVAASAPSAGSALRGSATSPSNDATVAVAAPSVDASGSDSVAVDTGDSKAEDLASAVSQAVANKKLAEQKAAKLDAQAEEFHRQAIEEQRKIEAGAVKAAHAAAHEAAQAEIKKAKEFRDRAVQAEREAKAQIAAAQAEMTEAVKDAHEAAHETMGTRK